MNPNLPTDETMSEGEPFAMPAAPSREQTIPLSALSTPDESEQMTPPKEGDLVSFTVEAKVVRIEGENAVVEVETINGQEFGEEAQPEDSMESLQSDAASMGAM